MTPPNQRPPYDPIEVLRAGRAVVDAWTDTGPAPALHHAAARDLRAKWPILGRALDRAALSEGRTLP